MTTPSCDQTAQPILGFAPKQISNPRHGRADCPTKWTHGDQVDDDDNNEQAEHRTDEPEIGRIWLYKNCRNEGKHLQKLFHELVEHPSLRRQCNLDSRPT